MGTTWGNFTYSQWVGFCGEPCPHCLGWGHHMTPMVLSFVQYGSSDRWPNFWLDLGGEA